VIDKVAAAARPRTFYEVSVFEGTIYTAGKDSFLSSLITLAGVTRDLPTATLLGLQTAWINRQHQELEPDRPRPDSIFPDLLPLLSSLNGA